MDRIATIAAQTASKVEDAPDKLLHGPVNFFKGIRHKWSQRFADYRILRGRKKAIMSQGKREIDTALRQCRVVAEEGRDAILQVRKEVESNQNDARVILLRTRDDVEDRVKVALSDLSEEKRLKRLRQETARLEKQLDNTVTRLAEVCGELGKPVPSGLIRKVVDVSPIKTVDIAPEESIPDFTDSPGMADVVEAEGTEAPLSAQPFDKPEDIPVGSNGVELKEGDDDEL
jgi:hypothetical protein